jgi:glycosyltransferase involved in cell wall biosynthesis
MLFLGAPNPRKNVMTLLQAFAQLRHTKHIDPTLCLVVAGSPDGVRQACAVLCTTWA